MAGSVLSVLVAVDSRAGRTAQAPVKRSALASAASASEKRDRMLELSSKEKRQLLQIARDTVKAAASGATTAETPPAEGALQSPAGAFVTLYANQSLRGCIGTFDTSRPVAETVQSMAEAAATRDTRFRPVRPDEVDNLDISLSILAPPHPIHSLDEVEIGRDGLVVSHRGRRGVLLPKVAVERSWEPTEFLAATCVKARLDPRLAATLGEPGGIEVLAFSTLDISEQEELANG